MMSGCLHHVVNEHTWALDECRHADMSEEEMAKKPWMTKGSAAHLALTKVVLDRQWLKKAGHYYRNFRYNIFTMSLSRLLVLHPEDVNISKTLESSVSNNTQYLQLLCNFCVQSIFWSHFQRIVFLHSCTCA